MVEIPCQYKLAGRQRLHSSHQVAQYEENLTIIYCLGLVEQGVGGSILSGEQVTLRARTVSTLMYVTDNLVHIRDQMVELLQMLLHNLLPLNQEENNKMNVEVLAMVMQCRKVKEMKTVVLEVVMVS